MRVLVLSTPFLPRLDFRQSTMDSNEGGSESKDDSQYPQEPASAPPESWNGFTDTSLPLDCQAYPASDLLQFDDRTLMWPQHTSVAASSGYPTQFPPDLSAARPSFPDGLSAADRFPHSVGVNMPNIDDQADFLLPPGWYPVESGPFQTVPFASSEPFPTQYPPETTSPKAPEITSRKRRRGVSPESSAETGKSYDVARTLEWIEYHEDVFPLTKSTKIAHETLPDNVPIGAVCGDCPRNHQDFLAVEGTRA